MFHTEKLKLSAEKPQDIEVLTAFLRMLMYGERVEFIPGPGGKIEIVKPAVAAAKQPA